MVASPPHVPANMLTGEALERSLARLAEREAALVASEKDIDKLRHAVRYLEEKASQLLARNTAHEEALNQRESDLSKREAALAARPAATFKREAGTTEGKMTVRMQMAKDTLADIKNEAASSGDGPRIRVWDQFGDGVESKKDGKTGRRQELSDADCHIRYLEAKLAQAKFCADRQLVPIENQERRIEALMGRLDHARHKYGSDRAETTKSRFSRSIRRETSPRHQAVQQTSANRNTAGDLEDAVNKYPDDTAPGNKNHCKWAIHQKHRDRF